METVVGIFRSSKDAERAVQQLHSLGVPSNRIGLLMPGESEEEIERKVMTTEAESPGIGKAIGATVGGAMGVAGGASMGSALASLLVPGVGPVIAGGLIGAAILGAGGTATGLVAGEALENTLEDGLPRDELYIYEDALRKGHSVVIALTEDSAGAERARQALSQSNAETVDAARDAWWLGLRDAEEAHYEETGGDFHKDERSYRYGFEAALHPARRGRTFEQNQAALKKAYGDHWSEEAFRKGFERGQAYQRNVTEIYKT